MIGTFCSSLVRKRKELEELQENSKVLRAQLRSKKKGIHTLEGLLKDASGRNRRSNRSKPSVEPQAPVHQPPVEKARPHMSRFFVAGPNGLCVEFHPRGSSTIGELKRDVKQAFVSKRLSDDESYGPDPVINLIYQGRVLLNDLTVDDVNIGSGDTVVAVMERSKRTEDAPKSVEPISTDSRELSTKEMMSFLTRQHEITATEMRFNTHIDYC